MKLKELVQRFWSRVDDLAAPHLWPEEDAIRYANDALVDACERAFLIEDTTTPLTRIAVLADRNTYALDHRIVRIQRAKLTLGRSPLERRTRAELDQLYSNWETQEGTPHSFIDDEKSIRLVWTPHVPDTLNLVVWRRPLCEMKDMDQDEPEIAPHLHERLVDGMAALAYLKDDADTLDLAKAATHEKLFTRSFGAKRDANVHRKQRRRKPTIVRPGPYA